MRPKRTIKPTTKVQAARAKESSKQIPERVIGIGQITISRQPPPSCNAAFYRKFEGRLEWIYQKYKQRIHWSTITKEWPAFVKHEKEVKKCIHAMRKERNSKASENVPSPRLKSPPPNDESSNESSSNSGDEDMDTNIEEASSTSNEPGPRSLSTIVDAIPETSSTHPAAISISDSSSFSSIQSLGSPYSSPPHSSRISHDSTAAGKKRAAAATEQHDSSTSDISSGPSRKRQKARSSSAEATVQTSLHPSEPATNAYQTPMSGEETGLTDNAIMNHGPRMTALERDNETLRHEHAEILARLTELEQKVNNSQLTPSREDWPEDLPLENLTPIGAPAAPGLGTSNTSLSGNTTPSLAQTYAMERMVQQVKEVAGGSSSRKRRPLPAGILKPEESEKVICGLLDKIFELEARLAEHRGGLRKR